MAVIDDAATIRPPKRAVTAALSEKAQARIIRQKILEHEQHVEDMEALKITPDEMKTLQESFAAVKAEFVDLDGQSWETATAREMLVDWHARQATRVRPVPLSPGGLRMRRQQPRRSLSAVVSSPSAPKVIPFIADEDVFSDETVRARPAKPSSTRAMVLSTVDDDDDDPNDTTLLAPPDLSAMHNLVSGPAQSEEPSMNKGDTGRQTQYSAQGETFAPVFTFATSAPAFTVQNPPVDGGLSKTVLSSSPTLNQASFFDASTICAGLAEDMDDVEVERPQSRMGWNSSCDD